MSVNVRDMLELGLAAEILCREFGPFKGLCNSVGDSLTTKGQVEAVQDFIWKYLPEVEKPHIANHKQFQELFDKAMKNMVQSEVEIAIKFKQIAEHSLATLGRIVDLANKLIEPQKTWKNYLGFGSEKKEPPKEAAFVIEEEEWLEVETPRSYNRRVSLILCKWRKDPSLLLKKVEPQINRLKEICFKKICELQT